MFIWLIIKINQKLKLYYININSCVTCLRNGLLMHLDHILVQSSWNLPLIFSQDHCLFSHSNINTTVYIYTYFITNYQCSCDAFEGYNIGTKLIAILVSTSVSSIHPILVWSQQHQYLLFAMTMLINTNEVGLGLSMILVLYATCIIILVY
jgi:hypothetical protein